MTLSLLLAAALALPAGDDANTLNEKARVALEEGRTADAVLLLESAARLLPGDETLGRNLAWAYYRRGQEHKQALRLDAAAADFGKAAAAAPDEPNYALHQADMLLRRYQLDAALEVLEAVLARHPALAKGHLLRGDALGLLDRLPEALEAYAAARDGDDPAVSAAARAALERTARQHAVEKDYRTDTTPSFVIRHPGDTDFLALASVLDRARIEVCNALDTFPRQRALVVLYPPEQFRQVTGTHDWVGGLFDRKIRLPIADPRQQGDRIETAFRHEYTHLVVSEMAPSCPAFLNEGLAQLMEFGRGQGTPMLAAYLHERRLSREALPAIADLPASFLATADAGEVHLQYLLSYAFVDHVSQHHGLAAVLRWVAAVADQPLAPAYESVTGRPLEKEEELFRELLRTFR